MTILEVKDWDATEVDFGSGFEEYNVYQKQNNLALAENFSLHLRFTVGEVGKCGGDYFSVLVLTYDGALTKHCSNRRKIVLPLFDVEIAQRIVERTVKFVGMQNPTNWGIALSHYFHWEYENIEKLTSEQEEEMRSEGLWNEND